MWACQGFLFSIIRFFGSYGLVNLDLNSPGHCEDARFRSKRHDGFVCTMYWYYTMICARYIHIILCTPYTCYIIDIVYFVYYLYIVYPIYIVFVAFLDKNPSLLFGACWGWPPRFDPPCEISSQKSTLPLGWNENQVNGLIVGIQQDPLKGPQKNLRYSIALT